MPKLTILRGVSGSGKSTWAEAQPNAVIVSRDRIRAGIFGSANQDYYQKPKSVVAQNEAMVTKIQDEAVVSALRAGRDVIVDNTNTEWKYVKSLANLGYGTGAEVEIKVVDVPLQIALSRNKMRASLGGRMVPEDVIRRQHQQLQGTKDKTLDAPYVPQPYSGTPGKPQALMVGIDGTLAHNNGHRGFYDWKKVGGDDVDEVVANVVNDLHLAGMRIVVMSGRDEVCREETEDWLYSFGVPYDELFMRPEGDMRPDNIVKAELFDNYVRHNYDVKFVIDDRWQVCQMWLTMGLKVFNVSGLDRGEF